MLRPSDAVIACLGTWPTESRKSGKSILHRLLLESVLQNGRKHGHGHRAGVGPAGATSVAVNRGPGSACSRWAVFVFGCLVGKSKQDLPPSTLAFIKQTPMPEVSSCRGTGADQARPAGRLVWPRRPLRSGCGGPKPWLSPCESFIVALEATSPSIFSSRRKGRWLRGHRKQVSEAGGRHQSRFGSGLMRPEGRVQRPWPSPSQQTLHDRKD
ncbi:PREDICTED: uncharacterized protein LOC105500977 [Colobus angolensis palliatus]|uniref:uncharacterized protein LOC105500977 n=1 Tax=Colobus angolensis palliatus TaxID=336983 RepID=UPI0005F5563E|nr:PREDICTED: uncharacterized protein LOC105500977 [Colobus angolensis palliatus]